MSQLRRRSSTPNEGDGTGTGNDIQVQQANNNVVVVNQSVAQRASAFCRRHLILIILLIFVSAAGIAVICALLYHYDVIGQKKETATKNDDSAKPFNDEEKALRDHHDNRDEKQEQRAKHDRSVKPSSDKTSHSSTDNGRQETHSRSKSLDAGIGKANSIGHEKVAEQDTSLPGQDGEKDPSGQKDEHEPPIFEHSDPKPCKMTKDHDDDNVKIDDGTGTVTVKMDDNAHKVELYAPVTVEDEVTILAEKKTDVHFELEYKYDAEEAPETNQIDDINGRVIWKKKGENKMKAIVKPHLIYLWPGQRYVVSPEEGVIRKYDEQNAPKETLTIKQHGDKTIQKLTIATMEGEFQVSKKKI